MEAEDIERYLAELGTELKNRGLKKPVRDCAILLPKTTIRTRQQAQRLLDRYILPSGQQQNAERIENALNRLFGREA